MDMRARRFFVLMVIILLVISLSSSVFAAIAQEDINTWSQGLVTSNGDIGGDKDHHLGVSERSCCYRPDGTACTRSDMYHFITLSINFWGGNLFVDLWDSEEQRVRLAVSEEYSNTFDDNCFTRTEFSVRVTTKSDNQEFVYYDLPVFPLFCSETDSFSQNAVYLVQEGEEISDGITEPGLMFLCYRNQWFDADKISNQEDLDGDGATMFFDCDDNDPYVHRDLSMFSGLESVSPTTICGDGKDNACLNSYDFDDRSSGNHDINGIDVEGDWTLTDDDCDNDPVACESHCLWEGNKCDYLSLGPEAGEYVYDTDTNGDSVIDENDEPSFVVEETSDISAGFCCGASGFSRSGDIDDPIPGSLGYVQYWDGGNAEYACLHTDSEVVPQIDQITLPESCPLGDWCWVSESLKPLQIFTIKTLGKPSFDIIVEGDSAGFTMCNSEDDIGAYSVSVDHDNAIGMNRMACFSQGENFAIAECALSYEIGESLEIQNPGAAQRIIGDGVFALPKPAGEDSAVTSDLRDSIQGGFGYLDLNTPAGTNFEQTIDFTAYDYLEFFVKYTNEDIILPENIELIVKGIPLDEDTQEEVEYYRNYVLGYAVNSPLLETGNTIHVKVPVGDWLDVSSITIATLQGSNSIEVANLYLSKEGEDPLICSGVDLSRGSNWLMNLDVSDSETRVNGENICISRYGEEAWLGYYEGASGGLEVETNSASCCGNTPDEYYSGKSLRNQNGCFDSEPIASGETAMVVEYTVESQVQDTEIMDEGAYFDYTFWYPDGEGAEDLECSTSEPDFNTQEFECESISSEEMVCQNEDYFLRLINALGGVYTDQNTLCLDSGQGLAYYYEDTSDITPDNLYAATEVISLKTITEENVLVKYEESPVVLYTETVNLNQVVETELHIEHSNNDLINAYLFFPWNQRAKVNLVEVDLSEYPGVFEFQVVAEYDQLSVESSIVTQTDTYTYPCLDSECIYALPGLAPYKITNEYPDLYEMYFVGEIDGVEQEILITEEEQEFDVVGVLKVKEISQQVLFEYNEEDDSGTFYGCNAVYYIDSLQYDSGSPVLEENYGYCAVQGEFYCGYSDSNFLVSSWSNVGLSQVGYAEVEELPEDLTDVELELYEASFAANELNHSTSVVPGRNFVPNMDFDSKEGADILLWELLDSSFAQVSDELFFVDDDEFGTGVFDIESGYTLRSSRISLAQNEYYSYQDASECSSVTISLVNKDGEETVVSNSQWSYFPSADAVYLRIEIAGPCEFSYPYLQLVDELGASEGYVGRSAEELGEELGPADGGYDQEYPARAGAACCPDGMCWNGYACVGNMALNTYMIEDTGKDSYYRCIEGDWTHLEPQYDWNSDQFGFCESSTQCFVTSSLSEGASSEATVSDFYSGSYPTCVNDGEYLLDHYCDSGEWTSRTKFVASQLLSFAETDDYVLYCSHFEDAFVDYDKSDYNYVNYLAGEVSTETSGTSSLGDTLSGTSSASSQTEVCFSALENSETGRRLVSQDENTCINSVCVLKYRQGDDFVAAFGASMNLEADDEQSFLIPLGIGVSELDSFCSTGSSSGSGLGNFISCSEEIWYASELSSIIYAKDGISISSSIVDRILDWFSGLFDGGSSERSEDFLDEATNFNKLYLADVGDYTVRAVSEKIGDQETISVEYDGFDWPLCDFINNAPDEFVYRYQWPASPEELVDCELTEEGVYRVMTASHSEYWWPEFTSSLRIEANN